MIRPSEVNIFYEGEGKDVHGAFMGVVNACGMRNIDGNIDLQ
jgi:hypothetical protein